MIESNFDFVLLLPALLAGVLVLSIHVPLGQEVLKRGIIFMDLAVAQIAAFAVIIISIIDHHLHGWQLQIAAGLGAMIGASFIHWMERREVKNLEAMIGLLFVLAASGCLMLVQLSPESDALLHDLLIGQILWVSEEQLWSTFLLYVPLLAIWFTLSNKSKSIWFYLIFSIAITASVQLVGVYLVFASLIVPALASQLINTAKSQLLTAYAIGILGYILGFTLSLLFDLPTGAITVWTLMLSGLIINQLINKVSMAK